MLNLRLFAILSLTVPMWALMACTPASQSSTTTPAPSAGSGTTSTTTAWTATQSILPNPLYIGVQGVWTSSGNVSFTDTSCSIPVGTALGAATFNCTVSVPELTLHYSDIIFQIGASTSNSVCAQVNFQPYYFIHSTGAAYTPAGATAPIDCSGGTIPIPTACYGGVAPQVLGTLWPSFTGIFFVPGSISVMQQKVLGDYSFGKTVLTTDLSVINTNSYVSNNNTTPAVARTYAGNGVDYKANTKVDYQVSCLDAYANPIYSLKLTIVSTPTTGQPYDNGVTLYYAW